jgi:hypothetical protein
MKRDVRMQIFIWLFLLAFSWGLSGSWAAVSGQSQSVEMTPPEPEKVRAVSMKALQRQLRVHQEERTQPTKELLQFAGLKKVIGYLVDDTNNDLILFGSIDPNRPPLYVEDFVIALRNAWFDYTVLGGNTLVYSHPGCSIDPNPETSQRLMQVGQQVVRVPSFDQVQKALEDWERICQEPQTVRVMGIPFNTRFAKVMVKADYDMKLLVDGSDSLDVPGFASLTDMKLNEIRVALQQGQPISLSISMNRFWFFPGPNFYEESPGIVWVKQCPVNLLTEEMYISQTGNLLQGHHADPLAKEFAEGFSVLYSKVAEERPIYAELENLFRFVALAKILKFKLAEIPDITYLLEAFRVLQTPVDSHLPGRSAVKEFQHRQEVPGGYQIAQLWLPSCGGVGIEIQVE